MINYPVTNSYLPSRIVSRQFTILIFFLCLVTLHFIVSRRAETAVADHVFISHFSSKTSIRPEFYQIGTVEQCESKIVFSPFSPFRWLILGYRKLYHNVPSLSRIYLVLPIVHLFFFFSICRQRFFPFFQQDSVACVILSTKRGNFRNCQVALPFGLISPRQSIATTGSIRRTDFMSYLTFFSAESWISVRMSDRDRESFTAFCQQRWTIAVTIVFHPFKLYLYCFSLLCIEKARFSVAMTDIRVIQRNFISRLSQLTSANRESFPTGSACYLLITTLPSSKEKKFATSRLLALVSSSHKEIQGQAEYPRHLQQQSQHPLQFMIDSLDTTVFLCA